MSTKDTGSRVTDSLRDLHEVYIHISPRRAEREWGRRPHPGSIACPPYEVDLNELSPLARRIAELVFTTFWGDTASMVVLESRATDRERMRASGMSPEYIAQIEEIYGSDELAKRQQTWYVWPRMRDEETPVEYFERCAAEITDMDYEVVGGCREKWKMLG